MISFGLPDSAPQISIPVVATQQNVEEIISSAMNTVPSQSHTAFPNLALSLCPETVLGGLTMTQIEAFSHRYFTTIHPCYPIVEREWYFRRLCDPTLDSQGSFQTMVLSLCMLSMAFLSKVLGTDDSPEFTARRDALTAQTVLQHYVQPLGNETSLDQVITTFHLGLYFAIVHGDRAGHFRIAEAAHLAKSMGLHKRHTYLTMPMEDRRRSFAVFACVVASNRQVLRAINPDSSRRACELRQGLSEIIHTGQISQLGNLQDLLDTSDTLFAPETEGLLHLANIIELYDLVSPSFAKCARDQCDLDTCHLGPSDMSRYFHHLDVAESKITVDLFTLCKPLLGRVLETRWIEYLIGHRWLSANVWHIATRHGINIAELGPQKNAACPLTLLRDVARVIRAADERAVYNLGNGLVSRARGDFLIM